MRRQAPRNLHCAIESLAADRFVHQPLLFGFTRIQWLTHEDVHECSWCSDGARQPGRAAGTGKETKVCLRQTDQVVAILGNTKIARERELEGTGQGCAGDGRNYRLWHALAQRHGFIEESTVVGGVLGPLATGSAQGFRDLDERRDIKMTIEITGCAARHDDNANVEVAGESVQRFGERVAHLRVEVDAFCATKCNHRNSIGCFCRQNIGVHQPPSFFINVTSKRTFSTKKTTCSSSLLQPSQKAFAGPSGPQTLAVYPPATLPLPVYECSSFGKSFLLDSGESKKQGALLPLCKSPTD